MSLWTRRKGAFRRRRDVAAMRPARRAAHRLGLRRGDAGFGIVEAVVSVAILALIITPITRLVITTDQAANNMHLRAEAADIATQALETAQYQTANGLNPTAGITSSTQYSGGDPFTVSIDWELAAGTAASTFCSGTAGTLSSRIWTVKAMVNWGRAPGQHGSVTLTTLVSPALADLADNNAAAIAVPIYNADDATLETGVSINVSVLGSCSPLSVCTGQTIPGNETTSGTANSGSTGCAVFTNLYAGTGWTYTVTVTPPSPYVDPSELSAAATASGLPIRIGVGVQANTVTVVANPNIILAPGSSQTVKFQTYNFGGGSTSSVVPAPYLPISVESSTLLCSTVAPNTCVLGNGTSTGAFNTSSASAQPALLFPGPTVTGASPNYSAWAGDQADSIPTFSVNGSAAYGTDTPTVFQSQPNGSGTLTLPVYPLSLTLTIPSGTVSAMTAADAGGGDTFALNPTSGTLSNGGTSATGLPIGQFHIQGTWSAGVFPTLYVWILPSGVCSSTTEMTAPCTTPTTSAIAVTV